MEAMRPKAGFARSRAEAEGVEWKIRLHKRLTGTAEAPAVLGRGAIETKTVISRDRRSCGGFEALRVGGPMEGLWFAVRVQGAMFVNAPT